MLLMLMDLWASFQRFPFIVRMQYHLPTESEIKLENIYAKLLFY